MKAVEELKGASIIVKAVASIEEGEDVLIVTDWRMADIAERLASAAMAVGAEVCLMSMDPLKHDGNEPPKSVGAAMQEADVILTPTLRTMGHSTAARRALANGARMVGMAKLTREELVGGGLFADFEGMKPKCEEMANRFTEADSARITTDAGTDLTFDISGVQGNSHACIISNPGEFTPAYNIEADFPPKQGDGEGTAVFDGAIPSLDIGVLEEDVRMEIRNGSVQEVTGGKEADILTRAWDEYDDPNIYNIAQVAVGMNPECRQFTGQVMNDHGVYGNVHLGIGTSSSLGGETTTPLHFDAMMSDGTVLLDGEVVLEMGEFPWF